MSVNRRRSAWLAFSLASLLTLRANAAEIKIEFLPPPMEGTLSLGIYDPAGKLVRTLHREAEVGEFVVALNGLITKWDGTDDRGAACPPGKYRARGFMVGDLKIEGVHFLGNSWVTEDDSPRISRITRMAALPDGTLLVEARVPGEADPKLFSVAKSTDNTDEEGGEPEWKLTPAPGIPFPEPAAAASGPGGAYWTIEAGAVKQFSASGELRRTLPAATDDLPPVKIAASPTSELIFVLAESEEVQQLSGFDFTDAKDPAAKPKVLFEQIIRFSDRFEQVASTLRFPGGKDFVAADVLSISPVRNPLLRKSPPPVSVRVGVDAKGAFLAASDGLLLDHVSETPHLKWAAIGRLPGSKKATIFESDGAAIGEFKASGLENLMAFDAGDFELPKEKPAASPTPETEGSPTPAGTPAPTPEIAPTPEPSPTSTPSPTGQPSPESQPSPVPATIEPAVPRPEVSPQ